MGSRVYLGRWRDVPAVPGALAGAGGGQIGRGGAPGRHGRADRGWKLGDLEARERGNWGRRARKGKVEDGWYRAGGWVGMGAGRVTGLTLTGQSLICPNMLPISITGKIWCRKTLRKLETYIDES
jgi:hypothetical protein